MVIKKNKRKAHGTQMPSLILWEFGEDSTLGAPVTGGKRGKHLVKKWGERDEKRVIHLLEGDDTLSAHSALDGDKDLLVASGLVGSLKLLTDLTLRNLKVLTGLTALEKKRAVAIRRDIEKLVLVTLHNRDLHVVGGGADIFVLLASEDIKTHKMDLSVTVLASLRSGHINNLAGETLKNDKTVLTEGGALLRESLRCSCLGLLKIVVICHCGLFTDYPNKTKTKNILQRKIKIKKNQYFSIIKNLKSRKMPIH